VNVPDLKYELAPLNNDSPRESAYIVASVKFELVAYTVLVVDDAQARAGDSYPRLDIVTEVNAGFDNEKDQLLPDIGEYAFSKWFP
jgi:hypothetical protein